MPRMNSPAELEDFRRDILSRRDPNKPCLTLCSGTACHATGAGGAPMLGDAVAWADRIAQGNDALYDHAINGLNGMPAKGLCMDCSDEEIQVAVDYMVVGSQ